MKTINVGDQEALVDDEDYERISKIKWSLIKGHCTHYAMCCVSYKRLYMHRLIVFFKRVDHIDGNGLNNQKANLREATASQNMANRRIGKNNTSGYKGVFYHRGERVKNRWTAAIKVNGVLKNLGFFKTKEEAAEKYNEAATQYFGEFAKLNDIQYSIEDFKEFFS